MAESPIHQALFGYARGHRLLASSTPIPTDAGRLLRAATDTGVESSDLTYLTVLPIPEMKAQAFIRTWAAEPWLRPGSVWSHTLLVDVITLANADELGGILKAFRRPRLEHGASHPDLQDYRESLPASSVLGPVHRPSISGFDEELAREILAGIYGSDERVTVAVPSGSRAEPLLLAIYSQQWPRLRRNFAFRTRLRPSDAQGPFDLELVERSRTPIRSMPTESLRWVAPLIADLADPGARTGLRAFLRTFGTESRNGRRDVPKLVEVYASLFEAPPEVTVSRLSVAFPKPSQMRALKRALLGGHSPRGWSPPGLWPERESDRLVLAFAAGSSVDADDLRVGDRLAHLIADKPSQVGSVLRQLDLEALPPSQVRALVEGIVDTGNVRELSRLALTQPDLGVLVVSRRPSLLELPEVWSVLDSDMLFELYGRCDERRQRAILTGLLKERATEALAVICTAAPSTWWDLLFITAEAEGDEEGIEELAQATRQVLLRIGAAAIGSPARVPQTDAELIALLLSADLSSGIWRHASFDSWLRVWGEPGHSVRLRQRLATVVLLSGVSKGSRDRRIDAWRSTFPSLHSALAREDFDSEAWSALAAALPNAPEWDRCLRLRRGVVGEMRRDRWASADARTILDAVGPYRDQMIADLRDSPIDKGKKWLRDLLEVVLP